MINTVIGTMGGAKPQLGAKLFCRSLTSMKNLLKMGEFKYGDKNSEGYKFFKSQVMDQFYYLMEDMYKELEAEGVLEVCGCGNSVKDKRNGYQPCQWCNGCGYRNTKEFNELLGKTTQKK